MLKWIRSLFKKEEQPKYYRLFITYPINYSITYTRIAFETYEEARKALTKINNNRTGRTIIEGCRGAVSVDLSVVEEVSLLKEPY